MPIEELPLVLVVEDEALLLFSIADDLRDAGFRVLEASNADDAIAALKRNPVIRLVFTDVDMPGSMDGLKLSRYVRDSWPAIQIIVTSGKQRPDDSGIPSGCLFMPKPYSPVTVAAAVAKLLA